MFSFLSDKHRRLFEKEPVPSCRLISQFSRRDRTAVAQIGSTPFLVSFGRRRGTDTVSLDAIGNSTILNVINVERSQQTFILTSDHILHCYTSDFKATVVRKEIEQIHRFNYDDLIILTTDRHIYLLDSPRRLSEHRIRFIATDQQSFLYLTMDGAFGSGGNNPFPTLNQLNKVSLALPGNEWFIEFHFCPDTHLLLLKTNRGRIYYHRMPGPLKSEALQVTSGFVNIDEAVASVVTAVDSVWLITASGKLYARGLNYSGNLGVGNILPIASFKLTTMPEAASSVHRVNGHTYCLSVTGNLYRCGSDGRVCRKAFFVPARVLYRYAGEKIQSISVGRIVVKPGEYIYEVMLLSSAGVVYRPAGEDKLFRPYDIDAMFIAIEQVQDNSPYILITDNGIVYSIE